MASKINMCSRGSPMFTYILAICYSKWRSRCTRILARHNLQLPAHSTSGVKTLQKGMCGVCEAVRHTWTRVFRVKKASPE